METEKRKLFVGGIKREANGDVLKAYFSKYGEVEEVLVLFDKENGQSRCFGFVTFTDPSVAIMVLQDQHYILGRKVDVRPARPKNGNNGDSNGIVLKTKKIFVGGLPPNITEEEFTNFFKQFGTVTDSVLIRNRATGRLRGFGFITYDSEDTADTVLQGRYHILNNEEVEVKRAESRHRNDRQNNTHDFYHRGFHYNEGFPNNWYTYSSYAPFFTNASSYWYPYGFPYNWSQGLMRHGRPAFNSSYVNGGTHMNGWVRRGRAGAGFDSHVSSHGSVESVHSGNSNRDDSGDIKALVTTNSAQVDDLSSVENNSADHQKVADEQSRPSGSC